jgi:FMN phosphatase YigB (HAD superfamily)
MMVGDSVKHDIEGAIAAGWQAVLLRRSGEVPYQLPRDLPVIQTLHELPSILQSGSRQPAPGSPTNG